MNPGKDDVVNDTVWFQALMVFVAGFSGVFCSLLLLMLSIKAMRLLSGKAKEAPKTAQKGGQVNV